MHPGTSSLSVLNHCYCRINRKYNDIINLRVTGSLYIRTHTRNHSRNPSADRYIGLIWVAFQYTEEVLAAGTPRFCVFMLPIFVCYVLFYFVNIWYKRRSYIHILLSSFLWPGISSTFVERIGVRRRSDTPSLVTTRYYARELLSISIFRRGLKRLLSYHFQLEQGLTSAALSVWSNRVKKKLKKKMMSPWEHHWDNPIWYSRCHIPVRWCR